MKVRALRGHPYGGRNYKRGQEYEISRLKDANILVAVKAVEVVGEVVLPVAHVDERKVKAAQESKIEKKRAYSRKDLNAEPATESEPETKRKYSRRDLTAKVSEDFDSPPDEE